MRIAIQDRMLPGDTLAERLAVAAELGVEGVELSGREPLMEMIPQIERDFAGTGLVVSSVCTQPHHDWLHPDPACREVALEETRRNLEFCGHFGAAGHIVPPIFGPALIPDLSPWKTAEELERELLAIQVAELAEFAHRHGTNLLLEPLNRYEQHLLQTQQDGVDVIQMAGDPEGVLLLTDFFHMHIEETDTPATIRAAGRYIGHIHVADNTRLEPGTGDIDWQAGLQALRDIGFEGWLAYECGLSGDGISVSALKTSVAFLRDVLASLDD